MRCYFLVDTYIDDNHDRGLYDEYIREIKPIVEEFGGEYLVRTEKITSLHNKRVPQRVIVIRFPSRQALEACFASERYRKIMANQTLPLNVSDEMKSDDERQNCVGLECGEGLCSSSAPDTSCLMNKKRQYIKIYNASLHSLLFS